VPGRRDWTCENEQRRAEHEYCSCHQFPGFFIEKELAKCSLVVYQIVNGKTPTFVLNDFQRKKKKKKKHALLSSFSLFPIFFLTSFNFFNKGFTFIPSNILFIYSDESFRTLPFPVIV